MMGPENDVGALQSGYWQVLWVLAEGICNLPQERRDFLMNVEYPALLDRRVFFDLQRFVQVITDEKHSDDRRAAA